ncbi:MAG TPA: hypothetical protein PKZ77_07450 [Pseudomonadales bacterium]|nr:hypothetical protein [Pseudomonadales bacterium]
MCISRRVLAVALMIAASTAGAQDRLLTVTCAEAGALELAVPAAWSAQESRHDQRIPATLTLSAPDGQSQWVVTAVWKAAERKPPATLDEIRTRVLRTAETVGVFRATLKPLPAAAPTGYYFDAGPGITPEPYTALRQGMLKVGELTVSFTAMSTASHAADLDSAVEHLGRARHLP